jgi:hypothetical protein
MLWEITNFLTVISHTAVAFPFLQRHTMQLTASPGQSVALERCTELKGSFLRAVLGSCGDSGEDETKCDYLEADGWPEIPNRSLCQQTDLMHPEWENAEKLLRHETLTYL